MNRLSALQIVTLMTISFCSSAQAQPPMPSSPPSQTAPAVETVPPSGRPTTPPPPSQETLRTSDTPSSQSTGETRNTTTGSGATNSSVTTSPSASTAWNSPTAPALPKPNLEGLTPQQVYFKYVDALNNAKTLDDLHWYMAQESKDKMKKAMESPGKDAATKSGMLLGLIKSMLPTGIKLKKESITGDTATLELTATDSGAFGSALGKGFEQIGTGIAQAFGAKPGAAPKPIKSITTGSVTMRKQDGVWKVGEEKWSTKVGESAKPPSPQKSWAFEAKHMEYPKSPASGKIHGVPFKVENAELNNGILTLRQGKDFFADRQFMIFLFGNKNQTFENTSYLSPADNGAHVHVSSRRPGESCPHTDMYFSSDYGMKLQFGKAQANKMIPGYIVLRMADKEGSCVQGYFYAVQK